jgi:uncharacterized protein with HEPN domain
MSRDDAFLLDALRASRNAVTFLGGTDLAGFSEDEKTQSAVVHQLLVLGEAVKRLSTAFREAHPEIPWRKIAGFRDVLIHEYDAIDFAGVWKTVREDLPDLIRSLHRLAPTREP